MTTRRLPLVLALAGLAAATVSCGGSDGDADASPLDAAVATAPDSPNVDTETDSSAAPTDGSDGAPDAGAIGDATDDLADAIGLDDALAGVGIDTIAYALSSALGGEYEIVGDSTIRLILDDGTLESDGMVNCIAAGAVVQPGTEVELVFPDGEMTCD